MADTDDTTHHNQTNVVQLHRSMTTIVTKTQLAQHLDRSTRWIELQVAKGMPILEATDRYGRRRFDVTVVEEWLTQGKPREKIDRTALLEARVRELERRLDQLEHATP